MHLYRIVQLNAFQICQLDGYRFNTAMSFFCQSQWPRGLRLRSAAACLLRSWVRIPPGAWIFVCCECRVLSGRGHCDELITRPEESYRLCCVVVCDLETSRICAPYIYDISRQRVNENPSRGTRVVPCGRTDGRKDRRTGMTKQIVAFRNFANTPKTSA